MNQAYDANRVTNRDAKPPADIERHIASLKRSIEALRAAGLPTTFYENALAALEGTK